jgi:hypothetical protein
LTTPSTRSAPNQTRILLPLAATAGRKEEELVGLADKGDGHSALIYRGDAGTSPPPRSTGVAGELSIGSGRRDERSSQLQATVKHERERRGRK